MNDPTPVPTQESGSLPVPAVFDPAGHDADAPDLAASDTVVLLLAAGGHLDWASEAAVALSTAWARGGRRIVLADLHLETPSLHERVGLSNLEGMVDIFLYGSSIARSARPVRGAGFYLISAGTYEADAEAIYLHPRWPKLVAGFRDASASLVLFAPLETADLHALSRWVDRVVLLGDPRDPRRLAPFRERQVPVDASLVPPPPAPFPFADELPVLEQTLEAPPRRLRTAAETESPAGSPHGFSEDRDLLLPPPPPREPRSGGRRVWPLLLAVLLGMGLLGLLGYLMAGGQPGLFGGALSGTGLADGVVSPEPDAASAPGRSGEALPFSVQVKAFSSFPAARQELGAQQARFDSVPFFVSPEEVQGVLYFKILAGLAADTAGANRLQGELIDSGAINPEDAVGAWSLIRPTPFAFDLGEFGTEQEARARADSLLAREIPTYAVQMPYSDGSGRWQLYGGAYPDSASADALRRRLVAVGLQPRLVLRLGRPSTGEGSAAP